MINYAERLGDTGVAALRAGWADDLRAIDAEPLRSLDRGELPPELHDFLDPQATRA